MAVRDSGVGLTSTQRDGIFNAVHTTKTRGMGVGLAISRSIMDAYGGRRTGANDGPGATFQFTLPLWAPAGTS